MKKQILLISLVILTVLQCACGSSGDLPDGTDTEALVETDVITADEETEEYGLTSPHVSCLYYLYKENTNRR